MEKNFFKLTWPLSGALLFLLFALFWDQLPETLPMKYDFKGNPIRYQSKSGFLSFFTLFGIGMNLFLYLIGRYIRKVSPNWINWPDRDWWFQAPERKEILYQRISHVLGLQATVFNLVCTFVFGMILGRAGLTPWPLAPQANIVVILVLSLSTLLFLPKFIKKPTSL